MATTRTKPFSHDAVPFRPGVYEREIGGHWRFARYDGGWYQSALTVDGALAAAFRANTWTKTRWRGLAEEPKFIENVGTTIDNEADSED